MIIDNINKLIEEKKWKRKDFVEKFLELNPILKSKGTPPSEKSIYAFLNGTRGFDAELYSYIAKTLGVTEQDLFNPASKEKIAKDEIKRNPSKYDIVDEKMVSIPYYEDDYACAGSSLTFSENKKQTSVTFDKDFLKNETGLLNPERFHIVNMIGNSMEQTLKENSKLIVNPMSSEGSIRSGAIYTLVYDESTWVKRVSYNPTDGSYILYSDNDKFHPEIVVLKKDSHKLNIIGRVVGSFSFV